MPEHGLGGLPGRVQRPGLQQLAAQRGGGAGRGGQRQRGVPVGQLGDGQRLPGAGLLGVGDHGRGGGDLLGQLAGAVALGGGADGEGAGQPPGPALGGAVRLADRLAGGRRLGDPLQQLQRAAGEVAFGGELGPAAELGGEAVDQVGQAVGVPGVGDGAQQQVGEVGVVLDREQPGRLALVGVHLALVAEQLRVQAQHAQVLDPAVVALLPGQVEVRVGLAGLGERVAEALHGAPPAPGGDLGDAVLLAGRGQQRGALGHRQRLQAEAGARPEGVPGLGELARVGRDLASAPLADLADDDALAGDGVLPLQRHMAAVVGQQELAQHAGAGAAEGVAVAGQHHREDQLQQHRLAAAVLQEQHAGRGGAADRAGLLLVEEAGLPGRWFRDGVADVAQVEHGVGVPGTGGADGVQADTVQLVHGASVLRGRGWRDGCCWVRRSGRAGRRRRPAPRSGPGAAGWRCRR